ncbi:MULTISPECIES: RNA-binding domain-containing protein [unclassified Flavobacterium]|jgi:ATP-dependent DNA helicase RecG|uniref:RNA-binding domain-containing protein n=1 Tax=unclassified Flavobacterium TaxID=196869 RepID=UPI0025BFDFF3|nr:MULTISPECIES: RNA-binding domain-containing protein [unclassified Flavobacterium]
MTEVELKQYIQTHFPKENEACEWKDFKSLKHSFGGQAGDDIISYISAIANMEGGYIVVGIKDKTQDISGITEFNNYTTQNIKLKIVEKCTNINSEKLKVEEFKTSDTEKIVWVFHIPKHLPRLIVYSHSKAWQRIEDSLVDLKKERQDAILKEPISINEDWSSQIIPTATLDDLDPKAITKAREEYKEKKPKKATECDLWDDTTFLNKAKVTIQGKITNTAILLLGKEESAHYINPAIAKISWILKDEYNVERDYEHFSVPFIINSTEVFNRVRNLTYRYMKDDSLFPTEIKMYDSFVIREALHNCIAHQDYAMQGRITVVEKPDELIFSNVGSFIPKSVETVIEQDAPQEYYRNAFLAEAMVNLNMIDTIGSGIKRMFIEQRKRFFPLPDFDLSDPSKVVVKIAGRIWDENYTKLLMSKTDLDLKTVVLLDRVQKSLPISENEIKLLRKEKLVEGRKNSLYISASIAKVTGDKSSYIKLRGFKDEHYKKMILDYLGAYRTASKQDIDKLILDILPNILDENKKANKVRNLVYAMSKRDKTIVNKGTTRNPVWQKV